MGSFNEKFELDNSGVGNFETCILVFAIQVPGSGTDFERWWQSETRNIEPLKNGIRFPAFRFRNVYNLTLMGNAAPIDAFVALAPKNPKWDSETIASDMIGRAKQYNKEFDFLPATPQHTGLTVNQILTLIEENYLDLPTLETMLALTVSKENQEARIRKNLSELSNSFLGFIEAARERRRNDLLQRLPNISEIPQDVPTRWEIVEWLF